MRQDPSCHLRGSARRTQGQGGREERPRPKRREKGRWGWYKVSPWEKAVPVG